VNRILAFLWLAIAVLDFAWLWLSPDTHLTKIRGTGLTLGWVAAFLSFYNFIRWWGQRMMARDRPTLPALTRLPRRPDGTPPPPPDPNFNFTDPAAPAPDGKR
jgi:hypothetical protein